MKTFITFFSFCNLCILTLSCQKKSEVKIPSNTNLKPLITTYFNHFNQHRWSQLATMYADSCLTKDPSLGTENVWIKSSEIEKKYNELQKSIPDIRDSIVAIYSVNKNIIVEFISTGTTPDGQKFKLPICTVFEFNENHKIVKDFTYYDNF